MSTGSRRSFLFLIHSLGDLSGRRGHRQTVRLQNLVARRPMYTLATRKFSVHVSLGAEKESNGSLKWPVDGALQREPRVRM